MAEEYILKSERDKWLKKHWTTPVYLAVEAEELPTHSFESLGYVEIMLKVAPIIAEGLQVDFPVLVIAENVTESLCQHFKKAEGDKVIMSIPKQYGKSTVSNFLTNYKLQRINIGEEFLLLTPSGEHLFEKIPVPKKKPANIKIYYDEFAKVLDKEVK